MKWIALVVNNCILIFLIQLFNNGLASNTIYFCPYALFIFSPLILLPFTSGLFSVITTGLILDATTTLVSGKTTIILVVVYTACYCFRRQFKAYSGWHNMLILQSANAITFAFLSVFNTNDHNNMYYWTSVLFNLFFSQILIIFIASWFLNLQNSLLNLFGSKLKDTDAQQNHIENDTVETS